MRMIAHNTPAKLTRTALSLALCLTFLPSSAFALEGEPPDAPANALKGSSIPDVERLAEHDKSEVVYVKLSASGSPEGAYVVNRFDVKADGHLADYGEYDLVRNLSNQELIERTGNISVIKVSEGEFFYQGNMPSVTLPWDMAIEYELDGKRVSTEELAGKSGELVIHMTTHEGQGVDPAFFESFMLQVTFMMAGDVASGIVADGAILASAGADTSITFTVLPGHDGDLSLSAHVSDFEMAGIQITALPYSSAIEMPDTTGMEDGLNELADGTAQIADGTSSLAFGARELSDGASGAASGATSLKDGLAYLESSSNDLLAGSEAMGKALQDAASATSNLDLSGLQEPITLPDALEQVAASLDPETQQAQIATLRQIAQSLRESLAGIDAERIAGLSSGLNQLAAQYQSFHEGLEGYAGGVSAIAQGYDELVSGLESFSDGTSRLANGADELATGARKLSDSTSSLPATMRSEMDSMMSEYDFPEFDPVSFTSPDNSNVTAVQFVMTTNAIEIPDETQESDAKEEEPTIWDRLLALFGL